jgi:hypothetical protein
MSRYKGRINAKSTSRRLPHIVKTVVPPGGLGKRINEMHDFHARHDIQSRLGLGRRDENGRYYIRWCFADPALADEFASEFKAT